MLHELFGQKNQTDSISKECQDTSFLDLESGDTPRRKKMDAWGTFGYVNDDAVTTNDLKQLAVRTKDCHQDSQCMIY